METTNSIKRYLKCKGIPLFKFLESIGKSNGYLNGTKNFSLDTLADIIKQYPDLNVDWLITGEGEMLKNSGTMIGSNQGDGNKIEYKNGGNVGVGNTVNVTLPESGTQKIIKPDGTVEVSRADSNNEELEPLKRENELLKIKYSHLEDSMKMKDDLIASQRETIELLRHKP